MRRNIIVTGKRPERTYEYEELGPVRIGKFKLVKLGTLGADRISSVRKNDKDWLVTIDDRAIWDQLPQVDSLTAKEGLFIKRFRDELRTGAINCLIREKIFNGGVYSPAVSMAVLGSAATYPWIAFGEIASILLDKHTLEVDVTSVLFAAGSHLLCNAVSYFGSRFGTGTVIDYQEPYVRHTLPEFIAPPIPVDRLARGLFYNKRHGQNLIIAV